MKKSALASLLNVGYNFLVNKYNPPIKELIIPTSYGNSNLYKKVSQ